MRLRSLRGGVLILGSLLSGCEAPTFGLTGWGSGADRYVPGDGSSGAADGSLTDVAHSADAASGRDAGADEDGGGALDLGPDTGIRWEQTAGPPGQVWDLHIDSTDPTTSYVASPAGVFKSTNGGASWHPSSPFGSCRLARVPSEPGALYAAVGHRDESISLFTSQDGARTWREVEPSLNDAGAPLFLQARAGGILYLGTTRNLLRSSDGGRSWRGSISGSTEVRQLAATSATGGELYAATGHGVLRSTDDGRTFAQLGTSLTSPVAIAADPSAPRTLYAGSSGPPGMVQKSTDGGASWSTVATPQHPLFTKGGVTVIALDRRRPGLILVGTDRGELFKSLDDGATWTESREGLPAFEGTSPLIGLVFDPTDAETVYVTSEVSGVFKSVDGGARWSPVSHGLATAWVTQIRADPTSPGLVYAATRHGGVFTTRDQGESWAPSSLGLLNREVLDLYIDASRPGVIYAATARDYGPRPLFISGDRGGRWTDLALASEHRINALAALPSAPSIMYAATAQQGVMKSTNGGATWAPGAGQLPTPAPSIEALLLAPTVPPTLLASAVPGGLFRSQDGAHTWERVHEEPGLEPSWRSVLAVDPADPRVLYWGFAESLFLRRGGVLKSTDGGTTWSSAASGLPEEDGGVYALLPDPGVPGTLYAGVGGAVYRSLDRGLTWAPVSSAIDRAGAVSSLHLVESSPRLLYAGTQSRGVWLGRIEPR